MQKAKVKSLRDLAEKADVSPSAITRLVHGDGDSRPATIENVAEVLGIEESQIAALSGREWGGLYLPPDEVAFLNPRLQDVITELIRSLAEATRMNSDWVRDEADDNVHPITRAIEQMDEHAKKAARRRAPKRPDQPL
jgi:transcriptional regulator with XRE-family HTH domain